uniref:Uncharacterized protein n=1 Tax=Pithovirus LCPAC302 TaxID=2506593 RepID=A0A481Z857_9VIRU|nr:MAG: hypothetical protein LCPAC302_00950 [Pithovirus LCPAC302]QBK91552.1 MAG: uncharacterized protein LCPAC302_01720 [Pithovirus LCPAC302]
MEECSFIYKKGPKMGSKCGDTVINKYECDKHVGKIVTPEMTNKFMKTLNDYPDMLKDLAEAGLFYSTRHPIRECTVFYYGDSSTEYCEGCSEYCEGCSDCYSDDSENEARENMTRVMKKIMDKTEIYDDDEDAEEDVENLLINGSLIPKNNIPTYVDVVPYGGGKFIDVNYNFILESDDFDIKVVGVKDGDEIRKLNDEEIKKAKRIGLVVPEENDLYVLFKTYTYL